jgi:hypothetical protein
MTIGSIPLYKSNLGDISIETAANLGSGLLINSTVSLANAEATFKTYKMLGCATILEDSRPPRGRRGGVI